MGKLPFETIKREILIKKASAANFGIAPESRSTDILLDYGVINIDKPKGPTSHQVSDYVQRALNIKKSGHSGSLDPGVTGVLPVAIGRATRIVEALLKSGKEYIGIMHLHKDVSEQELADAVKKFIGKIRQMPPLKSAVKRQERTREVYFFEIIERDRKDVLFTTGVEAGTYIRKLIHDMGKKLGGAHMAELRRTKAGAFTEKSIVTLQDLADAFYYYKNGSDKFLRHCIQPIETAVVHLPKIWVLDSTIHTLVHGVDLKTPGLSKLESNINIKDTVAVMTLKNELIAVGIAKMTSQEMMTKDKGICVEINKVFMKA